MKRVGVVFGYVLTPSPFLSLSVQIYDDEGLLARCTISETYLQTACGRPGSHALNDVEPGESSLPVL